MELMFGDLIDKANIDKKRVHMIRHALSHKKCAVCKEKGWMDIYTRLQKKNFAEIGDYLFVFESGNGTTALFCSCYVITGTTDVKDFDIPEGYPDTDFEEYLIYNIEECSEFCQYNGRIIIDWGRGTINWHLRKSDLPIIEILKEQQRNIESFTSYENVKLTFDKLSEIVLMPSVYADWINALSAINAIYVITNTADGKLYVGSSYGWTDGLLGRWSNYAKTKHGGNERLKDVLKENPQLYKKFQYSILQLLPKSITQEMAVAAETKWKEKLCTRKHGYNDN
ncbi:MAG: GIY-YIG nuclease family protein [Ruminococcus sp.]|nr:GIY-YIG nuclease family protein [Ruminococcus sp.]